MAGRSWKPVIGTKVWFACEHFWRRPGATKWQPEYEFMVYQGEVMGYRTGNWTDVHIKYRCEEGYICLIDIALNADKPTFFDNAKDAALKAQDMTNEYLKHWGWLWSSGMWPDMPPMPRRWEKYLEVKEDVSE